MSSVASPIANITNKTFSHRQRDPSVAVLDFGWANSDRSFSKHFSEALLGFFYLKQVSRLEHVVRASAHSFSPALRGIGLHG